MANARIQQEADIIMCEFEDSAEKIIENEAIHGKCLRLDRYDDKIVWKFDDGYVLTINR